MRFLKDVRTDQQLICKRCNASHLLIVSWESYAVAISYNRFCGRMPHDAYDDPSDVPILKLRANQSYPDNAEPFHEDEPMRGPIIVRKRKRYFSKADVLTIWQQSKGQCHICKKRWKVSARSRYGWHIDHKVPNIGGGHTEMLKNFFVACARCNLEKGGTVRNRLVCEALTKQIIKPLTEFASVRKMP